MSETQVHYLLDRPAVAGPHPDTVYRAAIESQIDSHHAATKRFQEVIDRENINYRYGRVLTLANRYLRSEHLETGGRMRIVNPDTVERAYEAAAPGSAAAKAAVEGRVVHGRAIVVANPELSEQHGEDYVLGVAIHEGAHAAIRRSRDIYVSRQRPWTNQHGEQMTSTGLSTVANLAAYNKADFRERAANPIIGNFWEESFADLTRVRGLRKLGRSNVITGEPQIVTLLSGHQITVLPNGMTAPVIDGETGMIALPAEYAVAATELPDGRTPVAIGCPNLAALALDMLDTRSPGLYEDMKAGVNEPARQAAFIRKVEAIQSGLYRQLGELEYNDDDFIEGLRIVSNVLSATQSQLPHAESAVA